MSAAGSNLAVVSLGVSCQSAMQIERHIARMPELAGVDVSSALFDGFEKSGFPFDWRIQPAGSFHKQATARQFFPSTPEDLVPRRGEIGETAPPLWVGMDCHFWHDFGTKYPYWDVLDAWDKTQEKHIGRIAKFLELGAKRTIFVLSNTQNNLWRVSELTGLDFSFDASAIKSVRSSLELLFPKHEIELVVVTTEERSSSDRNTWPAATFVIDQKDLGPDDVAGDNRQWTEIFRAYFADYQARNDARLREEEAARRQPESLLSPTSEPPPEIVVGFTSATKAVPAPRRARVSHQV